MKTLSSKILLGCSIMLVLNGCKSLGPNTIRSSRGSFVEALSQTEKEEMLANIVRAKYNDPPIFMKIETVTTSPSLEIGSESEGNIGVNPEIYGILKPFF